jgi:hypothetical protein
VRGTCGCLVNHLVFGGGEGWSAAHPPDACVYPDRAHPGHTPARTHVVARLLTQMKAMQKSLSGLNRKKSSSGAAGSAGQAPPTSPVHTESPFSFPDEDDATQRDRFERVVPAPPEKAFAVFCQFVWRENAGVGLNPESWVEVTKDGKVPGKLEAGMARTVAGFEEEVTRVVEDKLIEYKIKEGGPSSYHKGRVSFKPELSDANKTHIVWTIWWSPTGAVASVVFSLMIKGYCNFALYQLDRKLSGLALLESPADAGGGEGEGGKSPVPEDPALLALRQGEAPKLQFAARLQTGYEGNLTAAQQKSLDEFRTLLQTADKPVWDLAQAHPDGPDRIMLRFLRAECAGKARNFNLDKSHKRLADTLKFRQEMKVDELMAHAPEWFPRFKAYGAELDLMDREGRVVIFTRAGFLSVYMNIKDLAEEQWIQGMVLISEQRMQKLRESSRKMGHEVSATVIVYDLKGMGIGSRKIIPFSQLVRGRGGASDGPRAQADACRGLGRSTRWAPSTTPSWWTRFTWSTPRASSPACSP